MSGIRYYALRDGEEPPEEFVVTRNVDDRAPKFIASYVNTSYLSYENGVLLKMHERNDELRAENAKLRELVKDALPFFNDDMSVCVGGACFANWECCECESSDDCPAIRRMWERARELGVEVK